MATGMCWTMSTCRKKAKRNGKDDAHEERTLTPRRHTTIYMDGPGAKRKKSQINLHGETTISCAHKEFHSGNDNVRLRKNQTKWPHKRQTVGLSFSSTNRTLFRLEKIGNCFPFSFHKVLRQVHVAMQTRKMKQDMEFSLYT
jgi:hypothetical protein